MANVKFVAVSRGLSGIVDYVTNREKTTDKLITGVNCVARTAVHEFEAVKKQFHKTDGRAYYHIVQAFAPDDPVDFETVHQIGLEFAAHFKGHQCLVATHMNTKHKHNHIIIRKRSDGRWEGRYTAGYDPVTGKPIHKNVLGKTQAEVKDKLKKAIDDAQRLDMSRSGVHTVKSWIKIWYEVYAEPRLREKTKHYYKNYIDNHIIPKLGDIKLDKLTTIQIQKFYNDLQKNGRVQRYKHVELKDKGLSVRVVRGIHTLLNNCLEQAVAERLILVNPAKGCKLPKLEKKEMKVLPEEKIGQYLAEAERRGLLPIYYLELTTGLRRGELLALLWTDLDVENMTISVTKQVNRINGELVVSRPKTENSIRTIAIPKQAVDLLVEEHNKHPGNPYMFPSPKTGTMYDPDSFRHTHDKILKAIGAEHIRFHDLRHTYATLQLKNGVDVKTLSSSLGHYSAGFTLNTYTHATPEMKREAADTIGNVIDNAM